MALLVLSKKQSRRLKLTVIYIIISGLFVLCTGSDVLILCFGFPLIFLAMAFKMVLNGQAIAPVVAIGIPVALYVLNAYLLASLALYIYDRNFGDRSIQNSYEPKDTSES